MGAYRVQYGPKPLCKECRRGEVDGNGDLCHGCRMRLSAQKKAAAEKLKTCHEIAERLYRKDRVRFKDLFVWINTQIKKRTSLTRVLHSLQRLESLNFEPLNSPGPHGDVWAYLEGTLRRLEERAEAEKLRQSGPTRISDIPLNLRDLAAMKDGKRE